MNFILVQIMVMRFYKMLHSNGCDSLPPDETPPLVHCKQHCEPLSKRTKIYRDQPTSAPPVSTQMLWCPMLHKNSFYSLRHQIITTNTVCPNSRPSSSSTPSVEIRNNMQRHPQAAIFVRCEPSVFAAQDLSSPPSIRVR